MAQRKATCGGERSLVLVPRPAPALTILTKTEIQYQKSNPKNTGGPTNSMDVHHSTNTMDVHYTNGAAPGLGILRESLIFMAMILEMEAKQDSRRLVDR